MRKFKLTAFYGLAFIVCSLSKIYAQQAFKTTSPSVIPYYEYVPADYHWNSNKYPVMIFLHGIGERGPNTNDINILQQNIYKVAMHGPPKHVKNGTKFPFILISPQLKNNYGIWPSGYVMEVINHIKNYLRIDERRIYLTGLSLGGGGVWVTAQDYPKIFAGIAPVCGGYNTTSKAINISRENLPVWAFHGDKDTVVPLSRTVSMVNAINTCWPRPNPMAKLTIYPGVGHNAWDNAYKPDHTIHNPNVYDWIMAYTNVINAGNRIPVANAGPDQTRSPWSSTSITGSGIDTDGSISYYQWTKISGPSVTMNNVSSSTLNLSNLTAGVYIFRLKVTDNSGNTDSDYVKVTVTAQSGNIAPVANAGSDQYISLPTNSLTIYGGGSDPDGTISSYAWTKISGGAGTFSGINTPKLSLWSLSSGVYVFRLTVKDNAGASHADDVKVTVNSTLTRNTGPIVNAGPNRTVVLPMNAVTLFGSASDDGTIVSYGWTKLSGYYCTMGNAFTNTLKLSGLKSGFYRFRLTSRDNSGLSSYDDVDVIVDAPPVVNAGSDITITLPSNSVTLKGSALDADGTIIKYLWSKHSGPNALIGHTGSPSLSLSGLSEGTYVFKLVVTDNHGVTGADYVTVRVISGSIL